jgi:hypothetical protein
MNYKFKTTQKNDKEVHVAFHLGETLDDLYKCLKINPEEHDSSDVKERLFQKLGLELKRKIESTKKLAKRSINMSLEIPFTIEELDSFYTKCDDCQVPNVDNTSTKTYGEHLLEMCQKSKITKITKSRSLFEL